MRRKVNAITFRLNDFSRNMLDSSSTKRGCPGFVYVKCVLFSRNLFCLSVLGLVFRPHVFGRSLFCRSNLGALFRHRFPSCAAHLSAPVWRNPIRMENHFEWPCTVDLHCAPHGPRLESNSERKSFLGPCFGLRASQDPI